MVSGVAFSVAEPVRFSPAQDFFRRLRLSAPAPALIKVGIQPFRIFFNNISTS